MACRDANVWIRPPRLKEKQQQGLFAQGFETSGTARQLNVDTIRAKSFYMDIPSLMYLIFDTEASQTE